MHLIAELCAGNLLSKNVVIEDDTEVDGRYFLRVLLCTLCNRCDLVLLFANTCPPDFYTACLPDRLRSKVKIASKMPAPSRVGERLACRELVDAALSNIDGSEQKVGVLIDSVTDWLSTQESPIAIPVLINSLLEFTDRGNRVEQAVTMVTRGVQEDDVRRVVGYYATTLISLERPSSMARGLRSVAYHAGARKTPLKHVDEFNISDDCLHVVDVVSGCAANLEQVELTTDDVSSDDEEGGGRELNPVSDVNQVTFNLSLTPEERAAKERLVLPYVKQHTSGIGNGNVISYTPENTDYLDEDPDDDLGL